MTFDSVTGQTRPRDAMNYQPEPQLCQVKLLTTGVPNISRVRPINLDAQIIFHAKHVALRPIFQSHLQIITARTKGKYSKLTFELGPLSRAAKIKLLSSG